MPSSYTTTGIELIEDGEQAGSWGDTTNDNLRIISRMVSEAGVIALTGTTHTLTISDGVLSEGHYSVLVFGGSPSGTNTVTINPNDAQRVFIVRNLSGETVTLTQGSGLTVSIADTAEAIVYCDGSGSGANVVDVTSTYLRTENNLSDLADAAASLGNLGLTATAAELNVLDGVTATTAELNTAGTNYIPSGGIIIWSGAANAVPTGWVICDGTNSTPNLTGKFVVHADADTGGTYDVGATGGADSVTLSTAQIPSHVHTGTTSSDGNHSHSVNNAYGVTPFTVYDGYFDGSRVAGEGAERNLVFSQTTNTAGAHAHSFTTNPTGSNSAHENRPPYYALAYIMKT